MSTLASEIVIGIDFGTTYSGVSWAVNGGAKTIRLINNWTNPSRGHNPTADKVPSVIAYENGKPTKWGYEVGPKDQSFQWIKILLEPDSKFARIVAPVRDSNQLLAKLGKDAIDVVADYLRLLWDFTMEDIRRKQGGDFRNVYSLKVVITVPAMWSPAAKDKTLQAAKAAGISADIAVVTEPEAAALATLTDKEDRDELQPGDCFVVCDAGGGTVDLISYLVEDTSPLKIKECAIGDGDLCGSTFIDQGFEKWICNQIGESVYRGLSENSRRKMLRDFESSVKYGFDPLKQQRYTLDLKGVPDNPRVDICDEEITFKSSVVRTVFDHICGQIEVLIDKQVDQVKRNKGRVKAILLVGGFGESSYLYNRLEKTYSGQSISLLQVSGAWSSICRGATMWGLEHSSHITSSKKTVSARVARYSYGIAVSEPFDSSIHLTEDRFLDPAEGIYRATNQMKWLLRRGEETKDEQILHCGLYDSVQVGFFDSGTREFRQVLWYCEDDAPPSRKNTAVKKLCEVEYSISCDKLWLESSYRNPLTNKKWRNCQFDLLVILQSANLGFAVIYKDDLAASCEAKYPDRP